jgi:hypothetical protein
MQEHKSPDEEVKPKIVTSKAKDDEKNNLDDYKNTFKDEEAKIQKKVNKEPTKQSNEPNFYAKPGDPLMTIHYPAKSLWLFGT